MGFFSDLKEDLSQAVNELMPDEGETTEETTDEATEETTEEVEAVVEETTSTEAEVEEETFEEAEEKSDDEFTAQLEEMLNQLDEENNAEEVEDVVTDDDMTELLDTIVVEEPIKETKGERKMESTFAYTDEVEDETSVITKGMTITGDIVSKGSVDVLGGINGNIDILGKLNVTGTINGNSKASEVFADNAKIVGEVISDGSVKIGQSSVIIGNITATSAVVAGAVKGDIDVQGPVILDASAIVMGNIKSKSVQINNGAVIEGMCSQCYADVSPTSFFEVFKDAKK